MNKLRIIRVEKFLNLDFFKVIEKYINSGFSIFEDNEDIANISCYAIKNDEKRKIFLKNNIVNIVYFENKKIAIKNSREEITRLILKCYEILSKYKNLVSYYSNKEIISYNKKIIRKELEEIYLSLYKIEIELTTVKYFEENFNVYNKLDKMICKNKTQILTDLYIL